MAAATLKSGAATSLSFESRQNLQPVTLLTQRNSLKDSHLLSSHDLHTNDSSDLPNMQWTYMKEEGCDDVITDETVKRRFTLQDHNTFVKRIKRKRKRAKKCDMGKSKRWSDDEILALCKVVDICRKHASMQIESTEKGKSTDISKTSGNLREKLQKLKPKASLLASLLPCRSCAEVVKKIQTVNFEMKYSTHLQNCLRSQETTGGRRSSWGQRASTASGAVARKAVQKAKNTPVKTKQKNEDKLRIWRCRFLDKCLEAQSGDLSQLSVQPNIQPQEEAEPNPAHNNQLFMENVRESRKSILDACLQAQIKS